MQDVILPNMDAASGSVIIPSLLITNVQLQKRVSELTELKFALDESPASYIGYIKYALVSPPIKGDKHKLGISCPQIGPHPFTYTANNVI
jgi:hypothetical protein